MTTPCCCTGATKPPCNFCSESDLLTVDNIGFVIDGSQFGMVTDVDPPGFVIPGGCVRADGSSAACKDALNTEWQLIRLTLGHTTQEGIDDCVDYFGNFVYCDTQTCWWYASREWGCFNDCNPDVPDGNSVICRGADKLKVEFVIDATSDPDYILLYIMITISYPRNRCCLTNGEYTGGPYYKQLVTYRTPLEGFTCLCAVCFAYVDSELIHGDGIDGPVIPCLTFPEHVRVDVRAVGATPEQIANAHALCSDPDYQTNIDCPVGEECGRATCSYTATTELRWNWTSGLCKDGCKCPSHDELIARGIAPPSYPGQVLTKSTGCVAGYRPCSEIEGRCCYLDEAGNINCATAVSECDCIEAHGCWEVGDGIDCDHPAAGRCDCLVQSCCWNMGSEDLPATLNINVVTSTTPCGGGSLTVAGDYTSAGPNSFGGGASWAEQGIGDPGGVRSGANITVQCDGNQWAITCSTIDVGDIGYVDVSNTVACPGLHLVGTLRFSGCTFTVTVTL